jgi:RimJ/RimL family protein N-acetyltransferase
VGALVAWLHTRPGVQTVTAQTALHNRASERVLEKLGFVRTGVGWNEEDGELTVWAHRT